MGKAFGAIAPAAGTAIGGYFGGPVGAAVGGAAGTAIGASTMGGAAAPGLRRIGTGNSTYERVGSNNNALDITLDPSIRAGQESFLSNVRGLRSQVDPAFDLFQSELGEIRGELGGMKEFFAEDGDFVDAALNPTREGIARRRGDLDRTLGRTGVRGSFANQSRDSFEIGAGRELSDATTSAETARIQNLSTLLGMDANLLSQGLESEVGRTNLMMSLEESLRGVSTERFNQEMQLMGLGTGISVTPLQQAAQMNREGIFAGETVRALGTVLEGFNNQPSTEPFNPYNNDINGYTNTVGR